MFAALLLIAALPLPQPKIPAAPPLRPMVISPGGQRLLLEESEVTVRWDGGRKQLVVAPAETWVINYPLDRIDGFGPLDEAARRQALFGDQADKVRNWYARTAGTPGPEPAQPNGPAPVVPHPKPTVTVTPGQSIQAAVDAAKPGDVIQVQPGIYRESVTVKNGGTAARPIVLEGLRGADGAMPVITGNDPFPANAFRKSAWPGVYRADLFTGLEGNLSRRGDALAERSHPSDLRPGEFCLNRGSAEFLDLSPAEQAAAPEGNGWRTIDADADGKLQLGAGNAVYWLSTWVWLPPKQGDGVVWDPRFPEPITGRIEVSGFRAARQTGSGIASQPNPYRVWVDGRRLPAVVVSSRDQPAVFGPRPSRNYGPTGEQWEEFPLHEGWNHLVFQLDTTLKPDQTTFRFGAPAGRDGYVSQAAEPADKAKGPAGEPRPYLAEALLYGPVPATPDRGVYVRLPDDDRPDQSDLDLAARGSALVDVQADHVHVRGFEVRDGAQFQQRAQVNLQGEGVLLEGCLIRHSEVKGISFTADRDQTAAPLVIRNNWVVDPGNTGIGGNSLTDRLTADNQSLNAPGRSPVVIEHNTIINNNWAAIPPFWESGGMKLFRLTGCVIRYNTIIGGSGPGIWLDWEHYNNRLEGNRFLHGWAIGIGIEASPGPNLVCNNLTIDLAPGPVWFRYAHLSWSTDRNWVLHNTVDGRWNPTPAWQNKTGGDGIFLNEGGDDRKTAWGALSNRKQTILNNAVFGCVSAVRQKDADEVAGNVTDKGSGAQALERDPAFVNAAADDYRLAPGSPLVGQAVTTELTRLVRHDHLGLLRFADDGPAIGAFRAPGPELAAGVTVMELDLGDGGMERR